MGPGRYDYHGFSIIAQPYNTYIRSITYNYICMPTYICTYTRMRMCMHEVGVLQRC